MMEAPEYLTPAETAALIPDMTRNGLAQLRFKGTGPRYLNPTPRRILYRRADVIDWLEGIERTQTGRAA